MRGVAAESGRGLGTAVCGRLLQSAPNQPHTGTGLPLARRLINLYHPYDPVGHRLEPLAYGAAKAPAKAQYAALYRGSKRIHIGFQELQEDMSSAASRFGASLLSTLSFGQRQAPSSSLSAVETSEASRLASPEKSGLDEQLLLAIDSEQSLTFGSPREQGAALSLGASPGSKSVLSAADGLQTPRGRSPSPSKIAQAIDKSSEEKQRALNAVAALAGGPLPESGMRLGAGRIDFALQVS